LINFVEKREEYREIGLTRMLMRVMKPAELFQNLVGTVLFSNTDDKTKNIYKHMDFYEIREDVKKDEVDDQGLPRLDS
jgi:hypothetical protein